MKQGKGYWKFNNSLLKEPDYINRIKNKIEQSIRYAASP